MKFYKVILHFGFFITGIATVLIGPLLPILSGRLSLNDEQAGQFFIAQFSGSLVGTFIFSFIVKRLGFVPVIIFGLISISLGCLSLNSDSWTFCALGFFLNGIGFGTTLPAINMIIVELNPAKTAVALNFLNFFWGFGAILCPLFISLLSTKTSAFWPTVTLSGLMFSMALVLFWVAPKDQKNEAEATTDEAEEVPIWTTHTAWLIAFFNFLHVGLESGVGGWLSTYSNRILGETSLFSPTFNFFLFFVIGRLFAPFFLRFIKENLFLLLSLSTVSAGILILIFAKDNFFLLLGSGVLGFGTSAIFPTNMARFTSIFGSSATRRVTPLFICGSLGGAYTTWFIGYISNYYNNLQSGIYVLLGSSLVLIFLQLMLSQTVKRKVS